MTQDVMEAGDAIAGRSVLVAGATGGLGSAIATNLSKRGAELTLVSRRHDRLEALDVPGHRVALDLRDPQSCDLADRPIEGQAPKMPTGLDPVAVAATICDAIAGDIDDLPSTAFTS